MFRSNLYRFALRYFPAHEKTRAAIKKSFPNLFNYLDDVLLTTSAVKPQDGVNKIEARNNGERLLLSRRKKPFDPWEMEETLDVLDSVPSVGRPSKHNEIHVAYVLHNSIPYASGGYASRSAEILSGLRRKGIKVTVFARPNYPWDRGHKDAVSNSHVRRIHGVSHFFVRTPNYKGMQQYVMESAVHLSRKMRSRKITHVLAASNYRVGLIGLLASKLIGAQFLYDVRGFWEITRISREPEYERTSHFRKTVEFESLVANSAHRVWAITQAAKDLMIARGIPEDSISLMRNGAPTIQAPSKILTSEEFRVGYVGSIVHYEGLDILMSSLAKSNVRFHLDIVGNDSVETIAPGPILKDLQILANELGIANAVTFHGRLPREQAEKKYEGFELCIFARRSLPVTEIVSPLKPLEAMAHGKLVFCSDVGGMKDFLEHGKTGFYFKSDSAKDLEEILRQVSRMPASELKKIRESARSFAVSERNWDSEIAPLSDFLLGQDLIKRDG